MSEPFDTKFNTLDPEFKGFSFPTIDDESVLATLEGTCDELSMLDYESLEHISAPVIHKMYTVIMAVSGTTGTPLHKRYLELWSEE